jgi:hypothetical protein
MPMYSLESFHIQGYDKKEIPNSFYKHKENHKHLAVLLPGMGYTCQMPLLYYPLRLLLEQDANVFRVEYNYSQNEKFKNLSSSERENWLLTDVQTALDAVFKDEEYEKVSVIGKSLGTKAMGYLLNQYDKLKEADAIWLTPLFHDEVLVDKILQCKQRSLFITGTADPCYVEDNVTKILKVTKGDSLIIENADHSLEIENNILDSIEVMNKVLTIIQRFLTQSQEQQF